MSGYSFCRGQKTGLSDAKLQAVLGDDLAGFTASERLVIELADAMVRAPANISDDLYARLRAQFSEEPLMELSAQIAFENFRARWNRVFDVASDNLYTPAAQPTQPLKPDPARKGNGHPATLSVISDEGAPLGYRGNS